MNVISNAIKFSQRGFIFLIVRYPSLSDTNQPELILEIQDSGPGLTDEDQQRLFKPFSQADASITRKFGGTGLGLNLSRQLARLLGGDLYLEWSQPGVGSRFALKLPAPLAEPKVESVHDRKSAGAPPATFSNRNILIVEDNSDNQVLISKYLKSTGAHIEIASDGLEAIKKVSELNFDLILMDVQMPSMDGLQATTLLRQKKFVKPIVALTAHAMKEDRDRTLGCRI